MQPVRRKIQRRYFADEVENADQRSRRGEEADGFGPL